MRIVWRLKNTTSGGTHLSPAGKIMRQKSKKEKEHGERRHRKKSRGTKKQGRGA